jgi:hypothetical protein
MLLNVRFCLPESAPETRSGLPPGIALVTSVMPVLRRCHFRRNIVVGVFVKKRQYIAVAPISLGTLSIENGFVARFFPT